MYSIIQNVEVKIYLV